jgi:hypothetical protein
MFHQKFGLMQLSTFATLSGAKQTSLFHLITTGRFWREAVVGTMSDMEHPLSGGSADMARTIFDFRL